METVFLKIINMSITASYVILAVLLLRLLLRRAPKKYACWLWAAAGFRLCCPVSLTAAFSLFSLRLFDLSAAQSSGGAALQYVPSNLGLMAQPHVSVGLPAVNSVLSSALPAATPTASANPMQLWIVAGTWLWCAGIIALLLYGVLSYLRLRRRLATAVLLEDNVWQSEWVSSPFILGFFRPRIYIPFGLDAATLAYVLAHERCHLQRLDHLLKPLAFVILTAHWFNPLAWLAFYLLGRDMEMSCDERVLSQADSRAKAYSTALLSFAVNRRFPAPSPLAFGESGVKSRIKNALRFKQPARWLTIAAVLVCLAALAACTLNPPAKTAEQPDTAAQTPADAFVSSACLYMNPLSSFLPLDGDSGCRYVSTGDSFEIIRRATGETEQFTGVTWNYTAFTPDDWRSWFGETFTGPDISGYGKTIYFDLSDEYRVLNMDGELWLMQRSHNQEMGDFVWSVFLLVPESEAQQTELSLLDAVNAADPNDIPGFIALLPDFNWSAYSRAMVEQGNNAAAADLSQALYAYVRDHELDREQYYCLLQGTTGLDGAYAEGYGGVVDILMERDPYTLVWCYDRLSAAQQTALLPHIVYAYRPEADEATVLAWMEQVRTQLAQMEAVPLAANSGIATSFDFDLGDGATLGLAEYQGGLPLSLSGFHGDVASQDAAGNSYLQTSCRSLGLVLWVRISADGVYAPYEIDVTNPAWPTVDGVAVGDGVAELRAAYGDALREYAGEDNNNAYGHYDQRFLHAEGEKSLTFYLYQGVIYLIVAEDGAVS